MWLFLLLISCKSTTKWSKKTQRSYGKNWRQKRSRFSGWKISWKVLKIVWKKFWIYDFFPETDEIFQREDLAYLDRIESIEFDVPEPTEINSEIFEDFEKLNESSPRLQEKTLKNQQKIESPKNSPKIKFKKPHQLPKSEEVDEAKSNINGGWSRLKK